MLSLCGVDAEDSVSLVWGWDGAGVVAAEDTVAEAGDDGVAEFAQAAGNEGQDAA